MKLLVQVLSVIVFWLIGVGYAFLFYGKEMTFQNVESAILAFVVGIVVFDIVDRIYDEGN